MRLRAINNLSACAITVALLLAFCSAPAAAQSCGNPGQDWPTNGIVSGVVNTYYPGTASVAAGSKTISVGAAAIGGSTTPIAAGDLLLVIQMQDATITTTNSSSYGVISASTAGNYEFAVAASFSGGTVTLVSGLVNSYTNANSGSQGEKRFQVIRVPQYPSVTLGGVSALAWNGTAGGVVAFDVAGSLNLGAGGTIDVSGKGFRGGGGQQISGSTNGAYTDYVGVSTTLKWGGSKGEGIAGTPRYVYSSGTSVTDNGTEGWTAGSFLRGAPANAGGGANDGDPAANDQNAGGGGGGNGGPGGQGGNAWSSQRTVGGFGGQAITFSATSRVVMGGGGGAGSDNNSTGYRSSGAPGGGIVIIRAASVSGAGTISANGSDAPDPDNDGAGGGGAGGSVVVLSRNGSLSGLTINANGGRGGDTWLSSGPGTNNVNEHGPGGGGGGGVVYATAGASVSVTGGAHGVSTTASLQFGALDGADGKSLTAGSVSGVSQGAACVPILTVTKSTTTPAIAPGGTATYKITVKNAAGVSTATGVMISDALPQPVTSGFTFSSTTTITLSGNATQPSTTNPTANATIPAWSSFTIPAGGQVDITFAVKVAATVPTAIYQNPATATYLDPARTTSAGTTSASYDPNSSTAEDVWVRTMLSGVVFSDANHDGNQDSGEDWSSGTSVYVNVVQGSTVVQSVNVTAGAGVFSFPSVNSGGYTVILTTSAGSTTPTAPAGWIATTPPTLSYAVSLNSNPILNLNFGLFKGTKIAGTVFQDDGTGSGMANNGVQDGGEIGLTNFAVKATDTGSTTYDQTTTDSSGHYTLWLPSTATSVRVVESNSSGYVSTGASVGNSGGTYSRATDTISFTNSGIVYSGLNFGEVLNSSLSPNGSLSALPNSSVFYPHSFVATTTGQVTITAADISSPNTPGYSNVLFRDTNCNGQLDAGETQMTGAISVTAGTTVCFLVKSFVPGTVAFGANDSITVTAQIALTNASPALALTYTATDITTVGAPKDAGLRLEKAVDKATATSGTVITYTITYTNDSSGALSSIVISDATPAYTTFQSASCGALPSGVTGCSVTSQPSAGGTGAVQWTLSGNMNSSQSGIVTFSVKVN